MNEEPKVDETKVDEVVAEPVYSEVEQEAMDAGWMPKDEWVAQGKSPDEWRPAKEFKERGELFRTIHQTKRELKQTQATLTALQRHHNFVFEQAHQKAVAELKKERRLALRSDDPEKVDEIEQELEAQEEHYNKVKSQMNSELAATQAVGGPVPEFSAWKSDNPWYDSDEDMREYADAQGLILLNKRPELKTNPQEALKLITEKVKKAYPEKFGVRKAAPNAVAAVKTRGSGEAPKKTEKFELTEDERKVMKTLVKQKVLTEEQYIAELKKVR